MKKQAHLKTTHSETSAAEIRRKNEQQLKKARLATGKRRKKIEDMKRAKELGLTYEEVARL